MRDSVHSLGSWGVPGKYQTDIMVATLAEFSMGSRKINSKALFVRSSNMHWKEDQRSKMHDKSMQSKCPDQLHDAAVLTCRQSRSEHRIHDAALA